MKKFNVKMVKVNYPYGNAKYFIEKEKTFFCLSWWKREKEIIGGLGGTIEADIDFDSFEKAESYIYEKMNVTSFSYEEKTLTMEDLVW